MSAPPARATPANCSSIGIVTCSARYESRNAIPKNSTTIPMRAIVLPLVNQVHSDAVAGAVDAELRLAADAAAGRGTGAAAVEPGSPGPPLRTEPCSAGVGTGGASAGGIAAGGIAAGGGTTTSRSGSAASGVGGGVAPGVAAGIATPERASA